MTGVTLRLLSNIIVESHDETNLSWILLPNDGPVLKLRKAFANNLLIDIELLKT